MNQIWWETDSGYVNTANLLHFRITPTLVSTGFSVTEATPPYRVVAVDIRGSEIGIPGEYETVEAAKEMVRKLLAGNF